MPINFILLLFFYQFLGATCKKLILKICCGQINSQTVNTNMLIGLMGTMGSGKSTCANYLINQYHFVEKTFADPLKKACKIIFLLDDQQIYGTQQQKEASDPRWFGCSSRTMLQFVGTDLFRQQLHKIMPELGENIFIRHFELWYQQIIIENPDIKIVISDIRFQNELDIVKKMGGTVIKIVRNLDDRTPFESSKHCSEANQVNVIGYDYVIENNESIDKLHEILDQILKKICLKHS